MKINKYAKKIAKDLNLSAADALIMELKSKLYIQAAEAIKNSKMSHEEIALKSWYFKSTNHSYKSYRRK